MKKTRMLAALAAAGLALTLVACSSSSGGSSDQVTLKFAHWGSNEEAKTLAAMIDAFQQANPTIKVEDNWIQSDYEQKLTTSIAGGQAPDVAQTSNTQLANFQSAFQPAQVDPSKYYAANIPDGMKVGDQYYAVPFVIKPKVMAVNLQLFKKSAVQPPSLSEPMTVDQFVATAKRLTAGSGKSKTYGSAPLWFNGWLVAEGGDFFTADGQSCTLDTPAALATAKLLMQAQAKDGFAPTTLDAQGQDMFYWLSVGRLAMQPDFGPWDIAKLAGLKSGEFQLVPVPGKGSQLEVNGLSLSKSIRDSKLDAARKFTAFMSTDDRAQSLLTSKASSLGVPVTDSGLKSFEAAAPSLNLKAFETAAGQSRLGASVKNYGQITGAIGDALGSRTAIGAGHEDPAKVLSDLQQKCPAGLTTS
ncbi:extracellular solute-binding protein [Kribbella sp. CA-245084]|uniref:extracellular solute-binding protein n=1 Tax=Kribbella sp. CA-245084 TaxID=3239940 RepID=UPI003D8EA5FD